MEFTKIPGRASIAQPILLFLWDKSDQRPAWTAAGRHDGMVSPSIAPSTLKPVRMPSRPMARSSKRFSHGRLEPCQILVRQVQRGHIFGEEAQSGIRECHQPNAHNHDTSRQAANFLRYPQIPRTNKESEQALRLM